MSSPLAIAGVTYVLRDLLNDGLINNTLDSNIRVTARPPAREPSVATGEQSQLNIFLYQVSANAAWRNAALPSREFNGTRVANPPLALDLHYLVTAYDERDYHAEVLLGYALQLLHENPGLSRQQIRASLGSDITYASDEPGLPEPLRKLSATGLADQFESIKISPIYLSTDEMSKLWTGFQAPYRPSMAYQVSVVLIESDRPARTSLPVRTRHLQALPFAFPALEEISPLRAAEGEQVILRGANLAGVGTRLLFEDVEAIPTLVSETRLEAKIPAGLRAGVNTLRILRDINFGTPHEPHGGFESNALAFQVVPAIQPAVAPAGPEKFTATVGGTLLIDVTPAVAPEQKAQLLLNELPGGRAWTVTLPPRNPAAGAIAQVQFTLPAGVAAGNYLLRLRVDGADSALESPAPPAPGGYTGPILKIT